MPCFIHVDNDIPVLCTHATSIPQPLQVMCCCLGAPCPGGLATGALTERIPDGLGVESVGPDPPGLII